MEKQSIFTHLNSSLPPEVKKLLQEIGVKNPESLDTRQASEYLTAVKGIKTAPSSLEVYRSTSRGPTFKRIGRRIFYSTEWLDKWAAGIEIKIFDHYSPTKRAA